MPINEDLEVLFFEKVEDLRQWFAENHTKEKEVWVGYYKKSAGKSCINWSESVDEALCVGWIDGIRKKIDEISYKNRFTPRKSSSAWSAINIKKVEELTEQGRMQKAGLEVFNKRNEKKSEIYGYKQKNELPEDFLKEFQNNEKAWQFFQSQAPSYQKIAVWWVISAKQNETRLKRLKILIEDSENGLRIASQRREK